MRILGIDPGFAITGYSIIDYIGNKFKLITSGAVLTQAGESFPLRLLKLNNDLENIIDTYKHVWYNFVWKKVSLCLMKSF